MTNPMQENKSSIAPSETLDRVVRLAGLLDDFTHKMSAVEADKFLGIRSGTVSRAYRRGEIRPYLIPGSKHAYYTPMMLAEWLETYARPPAERIPG